MTVARPSLDDVYLRHTGRAFADADEQPRCDDRAAQMPATHGARDLRALLRQPWWIAITLVQPIIWLLLFGALFKKRRRDPRLRSATSYIAVPDARAW